MTHDPQVYPYPDEFIPERFEDHTRNPTGKVQPDPSNLVFGFGRRCVLNLIVTHEKT